MPTTWNNVPLILPDEHGRLTQWLAQFQTVADVIQFCGIETSRISSLNAPQSIAGTGITAPNFPPLPPLALNELIMPVGAQRFGYFVGFVSATDAGIGDPGSEGALLISDGTNSLTVKLNLLAFRPVTAIPGAGQLAMIVLVDQRYGWQFLDCGNTLQENGFPLIETSGDWNGTPNNDYGQDAIGYSEVFLALEQRMGVEFDRSSVEGFLSADMLELTGRKYFNAAAMLDAVAESCGMRVWVGFDGTVNVKDGSTTAASNFDDETNLIAGGFCEALPEPNGVQVNFPRASWFHPYADGDRYTITHNVSGGSSGFITADSCCYAHWTNDPDDYVNPPANLANLNDLASNIATAAMRWWKSPYDATFLGVKTWQQSGFDNFVSIKYAVQIPNHTYNAAVERDAIPKESTKFNLNYSVFTTRVQSMPLNFGSRVNLSQDPSITFLRGWQWGKLATASTAPRVDSESGAIYPQPVTIDIWQFDSTFKEFKTPIQVKAYDVDNSQGINPQGTRVMLFFQEVNRCWKYKVLNANSTAVVQVDSSSTAEMIRKNVSCLYPGSVNQVNTSNQPCGNGFWEKQNNSSCWLVTMNNDGSIIDYLPNKERYVGVLIGSYSYNDEPALPLYAVKEDHHLVRFQLIEPLAIGVAPAPNNAIELQWSDSTSNYQTTGSFISVVDPFQFTGGEFAGLGTNSIQPGYRGWAEWKPDREVYEIVWMENAARFIQFRVRSSQAITPADEFKTVTLLGYFQGRNPDPNASGLRVYNVLVAAASGETDAKYLFAAPVDAVGVAVLDDRNGRYQIQFVQTKAQFITGKLTTELNSEGAATGTVVDAWGPTQHVAPASTVTVRDRATPKIFTGSIGDQYQATYDSVNDAYNLTWVACASGGG